MITMNNITKLRIAVDVLSTDDQFNSVSFIGELGWKVVPEAYKFEKTIILSNYRIDIYSLDEVKILDIDALGSFQILQ
jgi:hypothetical protein